MRTCISRIKPCLPLKGFFISGFFFINPAIAEVEKIQKITPAQSLLPMLLGLVGILGVIFLFAFILKKFSNLNLTSSQIRVLDCQRLGAKEKLVIVEVQGKQLLLGVTPQTINTLTQLEQPIVKKEPSLSFDKLMKQLLKKTTGLNHSVNHDEEKQ